MKKTIIVYHKDCPDGTAAAAAAYGFFGDAAEYLPASYGSHTTLEYLLGHEDSASTELYILDFCFELATSLKLEQSFKKLVCIDHHFSSKDVVLAMKFNSFDINKSGASLTYEYFNKDKPLPEFIKIVEAIDIHKDGHAELIVISNYINALPYDVKVYHEHILNFEQNKADYYLKGQAIEAYIKILEDMNLKSYDIVELDGVVMPAVNVAFDINTKSRILAALYTNMPPVAMSYRYNEGQWKVSLRGNGEFDCATFASKYGGGGHKNSAGFSIEDNEGKIFFKYIRNVRG